MGKKLAEHRAGFVSIIGKPNVGKSTLLNAMMGQKLVITTPKAQTTRHRIIGIINGDNYQIVFSDTPGIIRPAYKLQESMMHFVDESLVDGDLILLMVEAGQKELGEEVQTKLKRTKAPVILVINKIDLVGQEEAMRLVQFWKELIKTEAIVPVSASNNFNVEEIKQLIVDKLPPNPPFYDKDQLSDKPEKFFASEIIREKILMRYKKEIPYSCEVIVQAFTESDTLIRIAADIMVERESQKGIMIGSRGSALKNVGTAARKEMENFFGKKVFLELFVKVRENWRDNERWLKELGYES